MLAHTPSPSSALPSGAVLAPAAPVEPAVRTGVYDGPLELLLFLIKREGVEVRDIPVARICDAYLAFLAESDVLDVDKAGDYLLMAATLCQLKVRELLPREARPAAEEDDDLDPREALVRRLVEYERYRAAAEELGQRERLDRDVYARPAEAPAPDEQPIDPVTDTFGLLRTFYAMLERANRPPPVHEVKREHFSLVDTCRWVLRRLESGADTLLTDLFAALSDPTSKGQRIFTFLSTLELARHQFIDLVQGSHLGPVRVVSRVGADDADLRVISAQEEEEDAERRRAQESAE
jgi:segregation and condensation protein A